MSPSRRRVLAGTGSLAATALGSTALAGCVTVTPRIEADLSGSDVFARVSATESWAAKRTSATIGLTPQATRSVGVRELVVVSGGSTVATVEVDTGQTSVSNVSFPARGTASLLAVDSDGAPLEEVSVRVRGRVVP